MAAAAAAAGAASSLVPSTSQRRLPFRPTPTRQPFLPKKALTLYPKRPRLLHPLAASSSSSPPSPPPPEDAEPTDPVKLAFARAAAYKKDRASPTPKPPPPPPPPPPQPSAKESRGSKEDFERALEYRNGNGGGLDGGSALLNPSPTFGQSTFTNKDGAFGKVAKKKGEYAYDETDFLGLGFFEKKRYQGPPPGLSQGIDPFSNEDFPEVEIVIGDPSKFGKSRRSTENQPVDDSDSEETSRSKGGEQNEDSKVEETPLSTVIEPEDDENSESYRPRVTWGMFPRPQNISKAYGGGRNISLGGETQSAEEKAAKDKRARELLAAYIGGKNKTLDAKTKAECTKALKEGDELMNAGRLKQALPCYEKVMQAADFKTELHGMAALQWSICLDSLCRSKEAMGMYSKLKYHPNDQVSKKAKMFMFSFQAADFLKVDGVPVPRNTGYEGYFDQFGGQRNYYANPDEPEVGIRQIIPYMIFLVSPIFFVAFIALRKSLML